jgi:hypothetical protein
VHLSDTRFHELHPPSDITMTDRKPAKNEIGLTAAPRRRGWRPTLKFLTNR